MVCMHCEDPTCAEVCPADAIKQNEDGVVQSSLKPRCIGCSNCVLACPFGVPKYVAEFDQMMKCDMCYDRTSVGRKPMCASVCPSEALWFGTPEEFATTRSGTLVNEWWFGNQYVATKVRTVSHVPGPIDVLAASRRATVAGRPVRPRRDQRPLMTEPVWRQDFPLTSAGEDEVTRREFVRFLVLASGGFAAGNVGIALWSSLRSVNAGDPRPIVALDQVPDGTAYLFDYPTGSDPAILVHLPGGELRAFSQKCTHLGCVVYYQPGARRDGMPVP